MQSLLQRVRKATIAGIASVDDGYPLGRRRYERILCALREVFGVPADKAIRLCLGCHTYDIERVRAAEEVQRVQKEFNDREERRRMREDRRIQWIASGYAASDFSQHDPGSEGEEEYWWGDNPNDWLEDDAMNYSGCS